MANAVLKDGVERGAIWRRIDLHLHSPGVKGFACPSGSDRSTLTGRAAIVAQYVARLRDCGISVCAITDYNGIRTAWFEEIRDEAAKQGIVVLPGAEVSFRTPKYGLHVLAIFPINSPPAEINAFLQALDRDPSRPLLLSDGTHRDIELINTTEQGALCRLRERFQCLLIPPHPDGSNGLCQSFRAADAATFLQDVRPDALEHCPPAELRKLQPHLTSLSLDDLALVEFSDAHSIDEVGGKKKRDGVSRMTFVKLSVVDIDALRLALHDPMTRLAVGAPPQASHARIVSMEIVGSGYLGNLTINWNDYLNTVIGGRGAGKSAILETLRFGLALEPYSEASYRRDLVNHALGSGGKVTIVFERPVGDHTTQTYKITRVWGEEARVFEGKSERALGLRPADLFGSSGLPTIFGQREIYAVSANNDYRLKLLDDLIGEEAKQRAARVAEPVEALGKNARVILENQRRLVQREDHRQRLKTVEFELSVYEAHGVAEKLRAATTLQADSQLLKGSGEAMQRSERTFAATRDMALSPLVSAARSARKATSTYAAIPIKAAEVLDRLEARIRALYDEAAAAFREAGRELQVLLTQWQETIRPLEEDLNRIKRETKAEALDPDHLLVLAEERTALAPQIDELDAVEQELKALGQQRLALLAQMRDRRHEEHQLRRERAERIEALLGSRLKLLVSFKGQKDDYRKHLLQLFKGSGVSTDAVERLIAPDATDGLLLAEAVRAGEVHQRFGVTPAMAERLTKWLRDDEARLFSLETIVPQDRLDVALDVDGVPRTLDRLSPGQRATAVLLLIFALEGRILVLDQPEDDLDNRFVYEDVVQILREQKGLTGDGKQRQIVTATHNPNIPVIGDAELVLALEAREGRARIVGRSSIDDVKTRELIKMIMEGGEEAFRRRAEKYGGLM